MVNIDDSQFGGGVLGGLMDFCNNMFILVQNSLGCLVMVVMVDVNVQNKLGMDVNGKMGMDFFFVVSFSVVFSMNNIGSGMFMVSIINVNVGQGYDYQVKYQGGVYIVLYYLDGFGFVMVLSWLIMIDGVMLNLLGMMNSGDFFLVCLIVNVVVIMQMFIIDYYNVVVVLFVVFNQGSNNMGSVVVLLLGVDSMYVGLLFMLLINLMYSLVVGGLLLGFLGSVIVMVGGMLIMYMGGMVLYMQGVMYVFNGVQMMFLGLFGNGDMFIILVNIVNSIDNGNVSVLVKLCNSNLLDGGMMLIGLVWNNFVIQVGVQVNCVSINLILQKVLLVSFM